MTQTRKNNAAGLLEVRNLSVQFDRRRPGHWGRKPMLAVEDVSFTIRKGQVFGLVGESGSGKTTLGRAILRLLRPCAGQVLLDGQDLSVLSSRALRETRRRMQIIFQDSAAALSPRRSIAQTLVEPLRQFGIGTTSDRPQRVREALETVGLDASALSRFPHQFSTGQRQRIMIARALIPNPDLVIADEAVSALGVSLQAQILELISRVQSERGIAFLFISHDLAVVQQVADEVGVMYAGRMVELAGAGAFFEHPMHPYSRLLLRAVPTLEKAPPAPAGELVSAIGKRVARTACAFASRCPDAMEICRRSPPPGVAVSAKHPHHVECHLYRRPSSEPFEQARKESE